MDDTYRLNVLTAIVSRKQHTEGTYDAPLWLVAYARGGEMHDIITKPSLLPFRFWSPIRAVIQTPSS